MAAPLRVEASGPEFPWRPPFTVDLLYELPDNGLRYEVLGGSLVVSPQSAPGHNLAHDRLRALLIARLPVEVDAITNATVRMPNGDGPVPDLLVTTADPFEHPKGLPVDLVHTVVEVVLPSNAVTDRVVKTEMYANAGIPCYWRVELRPWKELFGPVPAIVVRIVGADGEWRQIIAPAHTVSDLPVVVDTTGRVVTVKIDPAELVGRRRG
jgi:Uma2 family endonuclease